MKTDKYRKSSNVEDDRQRGMEPLDALQPGPINFTDMSPQMQLAAQPGLGQQVIVPANVPTTAASVGLDYPTVESGFSGTPSVGARRLPFQTQLANQIHASQPPQWLLQRNGPYYWGQGIGTGVWLDNADMWTPTR